MTFRRPPILPGFPHMLHGADWNPDQWPAETLPVDLGMMRLARINSASVGIFAWSQLEPEEGHYTFDWLDRVMDGCADQGMRIFLATPSAAQPAWMSKAYPEVLRVNRCRRPPTHGFRVNYCMSSPLYRAKAAGIAERLAERYGKHPALAAWHVSNEYVHYCFCDQCAKSFRGWLENRYGTIAALNEAWNNAFWSHRFTGFHEIDPPGEWQSDGGGGWGEYGSAILEVSYRRFMTDQYVSFMAAEAAPLRRLTPDKPVTTNLMGTHPTVDVWQFRSQIDVVAWDCYPQYQNQPDMLHVAANFGLQHDLMRALRPRQPFLMIESTPSSANWMPVQKLKRPGIHRLGSIQALAHGADSVMYFQWRKGRGGSEKFHGAVVSHDGRSDTRVFREVSEVGEALSKLDAVVGSTVHAEVAVVYDWDNRWISDMGVVPKGSARDYEAEVTRHYQPYWAAGVAVDVINQTAPLDGYRVVVLAQGYMLHGDFAARLEAFVRAGGTLVVTPWSGLVDQDDRCFTGDGPLAAITGTRVEETDGLRDEDVVEVVLAPGAGVDGRYRVRDFVDLVHADSSEVMATLDGQFYSGRPAITRRHLEKGTAWQLAVRGDTRLNHDFHQRIIRELGLRTALPSLPPTGVTAHLRRGDGEDFVFLLNFTNEHQHVALGSGKHTDAESGHPVAERIDLPPYASRILRRPA